MRRKPQITYQSPSSYCIPSSLRIEGPVRSSTTTNASSSTSTSSSDSGSDQKKRKMVKKIDDEKVQKKQIQIADRTRYTMMGPPLPLYHPLGRLALSLPELDPTSLGLPPLPVNDSRRSSARARRPAAKLREADEEDDKASPSPAIAAADARDKISPKKKGGARPGAGVKRKRKEADEDATYPAKKTRNPRGVDGAPTEASSPPETVMAPPSPEPVVDAPTEEKRPERRSTRSARGSLLRRDSSASEATSVAGSLVARGPKAKSDDSNNSSAGEGKQSGRHRAEQVAMAD